MQVIETVPITDAYCSGVSMIEKLPCGNLRLWCYTTQASDCGAGPVENVLVAKLVVPTAAVIPLILMAMNVIEVDKVAGLSDAMTAACSTVHH